MAKSASDLGTFKSLRGGVPHIYEVRDDALYYSAGAESHTQVRILWSEITGIRPDKGQTIYFTRANKQELGIWLDAEQMNPFLTAAIAQWGKHCKDLARKATFDYGTAEPAVGWITFVMALAFPGMIALTLLTDGYHEITCNAFFEHASFASAKILKTKKNRRGNFIWTLAFETAAGEKINGTREAALAGPDGGPVGATKENVTVIYAAERPNCWDLSMKQGEAAPNRRQRHFTVLMDLSFGWMFAIVAAITLAFSVARLLRKHPFREAVRIAGEKI